MAMPQTELLRFLAHVQADASLKLRLVEALSADEVSLLAQELDDIRLQPALPDATDLLAQRADYWQALAQLDGGAADWASLFAAFNRFMLLAAERHTVAAINAQIEAELERLGRKAAGSDWYAGRPVMVTRNDYGIGLFNGDIGLTVMREGRLRVVFPTTDGGWREVAPARLPEHDTVYAMTVHKSQGSEFASVWLALPAAPSAVLTRALVYTAITRARDVFVLAGNPAVLEAGVLNAPPRQSGLAGRLWPQPVT